MLIERGYDPASAFWLVRHAPDSLAVAGARLTAAWRHFTRTLREEVRRR